MWRDNERCFLHRQERLQVLVLLSSGYRHGGHDKRLPAVGQRWRHHPSPGSSHAFSQQPLLCLPQVQQYTPRNCVLIIAKLIMYIKSRSSFPQILILFSSRAIFLFFFPLPSNFNHFVCKLSFSLSKVSFLIISPSHAVVIKTGEKTILVALPSASRNAFMDYRFPAASSSSSLFPEFSSRLSWKLSLQIEIVMCNN